VTERGITYSREFNTRFPLKGVDAERPDEKKAADKGEEDEGICGNLKVGQKSWKIS